MSDAGSCPSNENERSNDNDDWLSIKDEFMQHIYIQPELRLKVTRKLPLYSFSAALCREWGETDRFWLLTIKHMRMEGKQPADESKSPWGRFLDRSMHKLLVLPNQLQVEFHTRKVPFWVFNVNMVLGYSWSRSQPLLEYRLTTKWSEGPKFRAKKQLSFLNKRLNVKCGLNYSLPCVEASGGIGANNQPRSEEQVSMGFLDVKRLEFEMLV